MSFDVLGDLNWLAVAVAAIAYFVLGAVWYARPVFGRMWAEAGGLEMPEGQRPNPVVFLTPLIGSALSAIALAMIAELTGTDTLGEGITLGIVVAVGFALTISLVTAVFESNKPSRMTWGAVNAGYHVAGNLIAAVIVSVWR
jgi:hypothetical protein